MLSGIDSHLPNAWTFTRSKATFSVRDLEPKGKRLGEGEPVYHDPTGSAGGGRCIPLNRDQGDIHL